MLDRLPAPIPADYGADSRKGMFNNQVAIKES